MGFERSYYILTFLIITLSLQLKSQVGVNYGGPPYTIADNPLLLPTSQSLLFNPSTIFSDRESWSGSVAAQRVYNTDISNLYASLIKQIGKQAIGLSISNYGIDGFRRSTLQGAYGMRLSEGIQLGVSSSLYQLNIEGRGNTSSINASIGLTHRIKPSLSYAISVHNLLGDHNNIGTSRHVRMALRYDISPLVTAYSSILCAENAPLAIRPGLRYEAFGRTGLLLSFDTSINALYYGVDIGINDRWNLLAGFSSHQRLGSSLSIAIAYRAIED